MVSDPDSPRMEAGVCSEHRSAIDQGARWLYEADEPSGGRLLMGRDLPPRIVDVHSRELLSQDGVTKIFTFVAEYPDGSERDVELELPPATGEGVWRIVSLGRGGTQ